MAYTVQIKSPTDRKWQTIANVKGDAIMDDGAGQKFPVRVLLLETEERIEVPMGWALRFSRERFEMIRDRMSGEVGQDVRLKK